LFKNQILYQFSQATHKSKTYIGRPETYKTIVTTPSSKNKNNNCHTNWPCCKARIIKEAAEFCASFSRDFSSPNIWSLPSGVAIWTEVTNIFFWGVPSSLSMLLRRSKKSVYKEG